MSNEITSAALPLTGARAWRAVQRRDHRYDGAFVYGVTTTMVYCRPICPSRRPARDHVRFFADPAEAERSGFRRCRRCGPASDGVAASEVALVHAACREIERRAPDKPTLAALAAACQATPSRLRRVFSRRLGVTPRGYAESLRDRRFRAELRNGATVSAATYRSGFGSSSRVYERGTTRLGMTPASYRRGAKGEAIRYTLLDSALGRLLVAATDRGICAVSLGDTDEILIRQLEEEFPAAACERDDRGLAPLAHRARAMVQGTEAAAGQLPLDIRATAFQGKVWHALLRVPAGRTVSRGRARIIWAGPRRPAGGSRARLDGPVRGRRSAGRCRESRTRRRTPSSGTG